MKPFKISKAGSRQMARVAAGKKAESYGNRPHRLTRKQIDQMMHMRNVEGRKVKDIAIIFEVSTANVSYHCRKTT